MVKAAKTTPTTANTFENQQKLPHLTVPSLEHTCQELQRSLKPFCSSQEEFHQVSSLINDFQHSLGPDLQQRLKTHAAQEPHNWLDKWWLKLAYHSWREPLPVNSNWFMVFKDHPAQPRSLLHPHLSLIPHGHITAFQIHRAAGFITTALDFKEAVEQQRIPAESMNRGATPLCMHQYTLMFGWTRVPKLNCDVNVCPGGFPSTSRHVIILVRDQMFHVSVYTADMRRLSVEVVEKQLWHLVNDAFNTLKQPSICILTGDHRDNWSIAREHLHSLSNTNQTSLASVESSLFCLSLDDWSFPDSNDLAFQNMAHAFTGHNRWFDKAISVVCSSQGKGGMNGEHSPCDALIPSRLMDWMVVNEPARDPLGCLTLNDLDVISVPHKLEWVVDSQIEEAIAHAESTVTEIIKNSDAGVLIFDGYGSEFIKEKAKVSPDAFVQMILQLAYYRLHGKWTATYETGSTRLFLYGRTETIRVCSSDVCNFVTLFNDAHQPMANKFEAFKKACSAHSKYTLMTMKGEGVDRHLLGLKVVMKPGEKHPLFDSPVLKESTTFRLSTSQLNDGSNFNGTGFGAGTQDGYGTNYCIGPKVIKFGVECKKSCRETSTDAFKRAVTKAFMDVRSMCENVNGASAHL